MIDARWGVRTQRTLADHRVQWDELELPGPDGSVEATISATSYAMPGPDRPVTFLWNGGPGASSSPLHLNAFGPQILDNGCPVPNQHTLLGASDLVFIDPVGTGFSRLRDDQARSRFFTVEGDAAATETFVRHWLAAQGRTDSVINLVGESYGGYRLAALLPLLEDLPVANLILVSPMLDATSTAETPGNDLPYVFNLPTMAVAGWHHRKASLDMPEVAAVWEAADHFARSELLPALHLGSALPGPERERIRARVCELIGVSRTAVPDDLRLGSEEFLSALRADDELRVGRLDVRITGPVAETPSDDDRPSAASDPALGLGASNVIESPVIADYLHEQVGVPTSYAPYVSLSLDVNFAWDWRSPSPKPTFYTSLAPNLGSYLGDHPETRVLLLGGYFDLASSLAGTRYALRHSGVPEERLQIVPLACGHSLDSTTLPEAAGSVISILERNAS